MGNSGTDDTGRLPARPPKPGKAMSVFVLLAGLGIVGVGAYSYVADSGTLENRVQITAEVSDVGVEQLQGSRGRESYVPAVTFQYRFRGASYTSDRIYPGTTQPRYEDRATAQSRASAYAVGERVTAYVDPGAPEQAFLEDTRSGQATGAFFVGVLVSLIGGVGLYQARREARARERLS